MMFFFRLSCVLFILNCIICLITSTPSELPGVRTLLTTKGLAFVQKLAVPVITEKLNHLSFSPISGKIDFFVGNIDYNFKNIALSEVKIPKLNLSVVNGSGISIEANEIKLKPHLLWSYKIHDWPFISDAGSAVVFAKDLSLNLLIGIKKSDEQSLSVNAKDCHLKIGNLDIVFHGGASFLYNFFMAFINAPLKNQLEEVICHNMIKAVNKDVNNRLRTIPGVVDNIVKHMTIPKI